MATIAEIRQKFPQYEDLSDTELADKLHARFYSDMPRDEFNAKVGLSAPTAQDYGRRAMASVDTMFAPQAVEGGPQDDGIARQLGLTARHAASGLMGLPNMVGDAANTLVNYGIRGVNNLTGADVPLLSMPSDVTQQALDAAGLPQPEGRTERTVGMLSEALAGTVPFAKGGELLADGASGMTQYLGRVLADNPKYQAAAGLASAGAMSEAREAGADPLTQMGIGMMAGMVTPGGGAAASQAAKSSKELVRPFTEAGRNVIVGNTLRRIANNPDEAVRNLITAERPVPGSKPTTAGASRDLGLAAAEGVIREMAPGQFADRMSDNNAARMQLFNQYARDEGTIASATAKRNAIGTQARNAAFDAAAGPAPLSGVLKTVDRIEASNVGVRLPVQQAMKFVRDRFDSAIGDGADISPERLYEVRKDIADAMRGKFDKDTSAMQLAKGQLAEVTAAIDDAIEAAAPGYKGYMERYARMSRPLDQMELMQWIRDRATGNVPDGRYGLDFLSQPKLRQALKTKSQQIRETLTPGQQVALDKIVRDLDMTATATNPAVRGINSTTFRNMSMGNVIGAMFAESMADNTTLRTITRPLDFLYKLPDEAVQELLVEAMLDPDLARKLMVRAKYAEVEPIAKALKKKAADLGLGSAAGTASGTSAGGQ